MTKGPDGFPVVEVINPNESYSTELGEMLKGTVSLRKRLNVANQIAELVMESGDGKSGFSTINTAIAAMSGIAWYGSVHFGYTPEPYFKKGMEKQRALWGTGAATARLVGTSTGEPYYLAGDYKNVGLVLPYRGIKEGEPVVNIIRMSMLGKSYYAASLVFGGLKRDIYARNDPKFEVSKEHVCVISRKPNTLNPDDASDWGPRYAFGVGPVRGAMIRLRMYAQEQQRIDRTGHYQGIGWAGHRGADFNQLENHVRDLREASRALGYEAGVPVESWATDFEADQQLEARRLASN